MVTAALARRVWWDVEPIHMMIYFVPEAGAAYAELGVTDWTMGYFGSRSAAFGRPSAEVVISSFFNFNPGLVRGAVPGVWDITSPEQLLTARSKAVDQALRRALGEQVGGSAMAETAELTRRAALAACDHLEGRPLFAAHAALEWPDQPHMVLWHAQTLLREYRGDGHISALVAAGLTGLHAGILNCASGAVPPRFAKGTRGWPDEEWNAGLEHLRAEGLLTTADEPTLSAEGRRFRQDIEDRTDELSVPAYAALGDDDCERLSELARPLRRAVIDEGLVGRWASNQPPRPDGAAQR